jgi:hypothetical protein
MFDVFIDIREVAPIQRRDYLIIASPSRSKSLVHEVSDRDGDRVLFSYSDPFGIVVFLRSERTLFFPWSARVPEAMSSGRQYWWSPIEMRSARTCAVPGFDNFSLDILACLSFYGSHPFHAHG